MIFIDHDINDVQFSKDEKIIKISFSIMVLWFLVFGQLWGMKMYQNQSRFRFRKMFQICFKYVQLMAFI